MPCLSIPATLSTLALLGASLADFAPELRVVGWWAAARADIRRPPEPTERRLVPLDAGLALHLAWRFDPGVDAPPIVPVRDGWPGDADPLDPDALDVDPWRALEVDPTEVEDEDWIADPPVAPASSGVPDRALTAPLDARAAGRALADLRRARVALSAADTPLDRARARLALDEARARLAIVAGEGDR